MDALLESGSQYSNVSLLSLHQPCLEKIVGYLDCNSLHSLLLTCRKLTSFSHLPSAWDSSVLYQRGIYLLLSCTFSFRVTSEHKISYILTKALDYTSFLTSVTPDKIIETWTRCGPVFGKLQSLINSYEEKEENGEPRQSCSLCHKFFTFELPSGKCLNLQYSAFFDGTWAYGDQEAVKVVFDQTTIIYNDQPRRGGLNWIRSYWQSEDSIEECDNLSCLNSIGKLLEEELGEVAPPGIDGELIKDFAKNFPDFDYCCRDDSHFKLEECNKVDEVSLEEQFLKKRKLVSHQVQENIMGSSDDDSLSSKATSCSQISECSQESESRTDTSQNLDQTHTVKSSNELFEELGGIHMDQRDIDIIICELANLISILILRNDSFHVKSLKTAFSHFNSVRRKLVSLGPHDDYTLAAELCKRLLFRADFDTISGSWNRRAFGDERVDCRIDFKLCGSHVLTFKASASETRDSHPNYYDQQVEFIIPELEINIIVHTERDMSDRDWSCLGPVTAEIQKCIDKDCPKGETGVPYPEWPRYFVVPGPKTVTNVFVATFFILLSKIDFAFDIDEVAEQCMADGNFFDKGSDSDFDPLTFDSLTFDSSDSDETDNSVADYPDDGSLSECVGREIDVEAEDSRQPSDPVHTKVDEELEISQVQPLSVQPYAESNSTDNDADEEFEVYYSDDSSISDIEIDPEELDDIIKDKERFEKCGFCSTYEDQIMN